MGTAFDRVRMGKKLPHYWDAIDKIATKLKKVEDADQETLISIEELDQLLEGILTNLKDATGSDIAFIANEDGIIAYTHPSECDLKGRNIFLSEGMEVGLDGIIELKKYGTPFSIETSSIPFFQDIQQKKLDYLEGLNLSAIFVVRLFCEHFVSRYIGMGISKDHIPPSQPPEIDPPYLGEDQKFIRWLIGVVESKVEYGLKVGSEEDRANRSDRYARARILGEWGFLARTSEDYASVWKKYKKPSSSNKENRTCSGLFDIIRFDDVLADYLDAELCRLIHTPNQNRKISYEDINQNCSANCSDKEIHDYSDPLHIALLKRFIYIENQNTNITNDKWLANVLLFDNKEWLPAKDIRSHGKTSRSSLALARICLWAGYMNCQSDQNQNGRDPNPDASGNMEVDENVKGKLDLYKLDWKKLFWKIPDPLIGNAKHQIGDLPTSIQEATHLITSNVEIHIDLVRTLWQRIYYLTADKLRYTLKQRVEYIEEIYPDLRDRTVKVLKLFLNAGSNINCLTLDSDWLLMWLISNVLLSSQLSKYYELEPSPNTKNSSVSPITKIRYLMYLSECVLYVLHCARHHLRKLIIQRGDDTGKEVERFRRPPFADVMSFEVPSNRSNAQLYILSEYAYREIGLNREMCIFERLIRQLRFELPLYAARDFYRDHLYHVIDVCLLGELFLRSIFTSNQQNRSQVLVDAVANQIASGDRRKILQNWYVAALFHDIGYVIEQADHFLDPIQYITGDGLNEFANRSKRGLEDGKNQIHQEIERLWKGDPNLLQDSLFEVIKNTSPTDHGIVAWLYIKGLLQRICHPSENLKPALTAILRHNLPNQGDIDIDEEPISFLLMLCDHLQEWGRPRVGPDPLARAIVEALRFSEQPELEHRIRMKEIHIQNFNCQPSQDKEEVLHQACNGCALSPDNSKSCPNCCRVITEIITPGIEFNLPHIDSREGDFEPAISWLLFCRDLQCLNYKDSNQLWFNITINLNHKAPQIRQLYPWQPLEMDLIEEFANTYKPAAYLCDWVEAARKKERGIAYTANKGNSGDETFTIELHNLKRPLARGLDDEIWKKYFEWKWHWLGHKYITLNLGSWFPE